MSTGTSTITLTIVENYRRHELLELRNSGSEPLDISGWTLRGSQGDEVCTVPEGTVLEPDEAFQIATGDSQPQTRGYKCGNRPIWNNKGETIYLRAQDGAIVLTIHSKKVQP